MYKNQLQELAQRSCFNLPAYTCIREGPDHAPRFKALVNFNGENFECSHYHSTLRQAEHSAAEVALNSLSARGPSHSLAARILKRGAAVVLREHPYPANESKVGYIGSHMNRPIYPHGERIGFKPRFEQEEYAMLNC